MADGLHVLVVDDELPVREVVRMNLETHGYRVSQACGGAESLRLVRANRPDLILLDLRMPLRDGWSVLRELRGDPTLSMIPVVMLTGEADESSELRAKGLGVVAYVAKPVGGDDLVGVIQRVLAPRTSGPGAPGPRSPIGITTVPPPERSVSTADQTTAEDPT